MKDDIDICNDNYVQASKRYYAWNEWGDLRWPQKSSAQINIDGGLFPYAVLNK